MSAFSNFAVSFTIISILSGCLTLYATGMSTGGPTVIVWGWLVVGVLTLFVGLAMAEVCSAYPTAGGLYFWAAQLARKNTAAWATFTGYDASAHMIEETKNAAKAGPRGIAMSIVISLVAGWVLLVGLTFAIQDYDGGLHSATGVPPAQIFIDAAGRSLGLILLVIVVVAQLFRGLASVAANSRMIFAFSRDGALPGSRL